MSKSRRRVRRALEEAGLPVTVREMEGDCTTAAAAAATLGVEVDRIAKSILFRGESGAMYLFLTAGTNAVDAARAAALAGEALSRPDAATVRAETGFAIGGVAPVGHLCPVTAFADPRLWDFATVWAAAGTPRDVFEVAPDDLARAAGARRTAFTTG